MYFQCLLYTVMKYVYTLRYHLASIRNLCVHGSWFVVGHASWKKHLKCLETCTVAGVCLVYLSLIEYLRLGNLQWEETYLLIVLEAWKSKVKALVLERAVLLHYHTVEGQRAKKPKRGQIHPSVKALPRTTGGVPSQSNLKGTTS